LRDAGVIGHGETVACLVTGTGFKDINAVTRNAPEVPVIDVDAPVVLDVE